jgi:hypothetical protein
MRMIQEFMRRGIAWALRGWRLFVLTALAVFLMGAVVLVVVPAVSPALGANTADFLRTVFGPGPVAELESVSFWMHDLINRDLASAGLSAPRVAWAAGASSNPMNPPGGINVLHGKPAAKAEPTSQPTTSGSSASDAAPAAQAAGAAVLTAAPQLGWQAYAPEVNGVPVLARAMIMIDPQRSYAGVALVRMDLSRLALHITPGTIEPAHPSGIDEKIPSIGMVPPQDYGQLVAAFNGGFKAIHGHYGMMVNGITLLSPVNGMGTLAIYNDGSVRIGSWGTDLLPSPDIVAFRQNCPPLIDAGVINPLLASDARRLWGFTNNSDITWRTAVGITRDGRFLIYAVGNGANAEFLAEALQQAGASAAIQLDINQYYAHFVTYAPANPSSSTGPTLQAQRLLQEMIDERQIYLAPQVRDFFYVTAK